LDRLLTRDLVTGDFERDEELLLLLLRCLGLIKNKVDNNEISGNSKSSMFNIMVPAQFSPRVYMKVSNLQPQISNGYNDAFITTYITHYFKMLHHLKRNSLFTFNYTEPT